MGKKDKTPEVPSTEEKPLPDPYSARPGTSGTELGLRTERRKASSALQKAQRAEQAYRAKRQATAARSNMSAAKAHFSASWKSLKMGCRFAWMGVTALPGVLGEKRGARREKREVKRREVEREKRRKLEEKIKRDEEVEGTE